jgi:hypothetical protein
MEAAKKIIMGAMLFLIGAILIGVLVGQEYTLTVPITQTDTLTVVYAGTGHINTTYGYQVRTGYNTWRQEYSECVPTTIVLKNSSGATLTDPTHYVYTYNGPDGTGDSLGNLLLLDHGSVNKSTTLTAAYKYCSNDYTAQGWARSILNMIGGFLALILLAYAIYIFYDIYREAKG